MCYSGMEVVYDQLHSPLICDIVKWVAVDSLLIRVYPEVIRSNLRLTASPALSQYSNQL